MENNEVKFNEPNYGAPRRQRQRNLFIDFLIKKGWAKNEKQALYILFGIIGISVFIMVWVFINGGTKPNTKIRILPQESVGSEQGR